MTVLTREIAEELIAGQGLDVVIPDGYTSIEKYAFDGKGLTSAVIPDSVTTIGDSAFGYNRLTSVVLADSTEIHPDAFDPEVEIIRRSIGSSIDNPHAPLTREWTHVIGLPFLFDESGYYSDEFGYSVSAAADGSVYIAGVTDENLDGQTNSGDFDAFLSKYNAEGSREWTKLIGSSSEDWGYSVGTGIDGTVYIAGYTEGNLDGKTNSGDFDAFLSKYNSDGSKVWTQLLGSSSSDYGLSVSTAFDGSVYIAGTTEGNLDGQTNSGEADAFLSKFNSDGSKAWTRLLGSSSAEWGSAVATAADGSVYITGETYGDLDGQTNGGGADVFLS